mgnify:CR=1 FL=1
MTQRGADRIKNNIEYIIFGAGEGNSSRFNSVYRGELHSTFPNILFSYGLIGFFIYMYSLYLLYHRNKKNFVILITLFIFTFAHMTLRIPLYWITIYLFYLFNFNKQYKTK